MLYNFFYLVILLLALPYLLIALLFSQNLRNLICHRIKSCFFLPNLPASSTKNLIWIHAASVGEVAIARQLQKELKANFLLTCNTLSGLKQAKQFNPISFIAPLDFSWIIQKWITKLKIKGLILIEAELWPNMILKVAKTHPVALINGRSSLKKQSGLYRVLYRFLLAEFSLILAANETSFNFYRSLINKNKVDYYGNIKFSLTTPPNFNSINLKKLFPKNALVFVAASLQPEEIPIILKAYDLAKKQLANLYLVLIPRHPEKKKKFQQQLKQRDYQLLLNPSKINQKIILVPLLGVLHNWYKNADTVFVGGSLCNRGGQNIIEPISYKKITATGTNSQSFDFAIQLFLKCNAITKVSSAAELSKFIIKSLTEPESFQLGLIKAQKIIKEQRKTLIKTVDKLKNLYQI